MKKKFSAMKRMLPQSLSLIIISLIIVFNANGQTPVYKDKDADIETRVEDLLSRMSLEEKIAQLDMYHINHLATDGQLNKVKVDTMLIGMSTGTVHDFYPESTGIAKWPPAYPH